MSTQRHLERWTVLALASGASMLLGAIRTTLEAQSTSIVRGDDASCASCALRLGNPIDLHVPDTTAALFSPFLFRMDSQGRLYFNDPFGQLGIRVFSPDGTYARTIGRRGQAPGEFLRIDAITFSQNDTMHVYGNAHWIFDRRGRHIQTLSTPAMMNVRAVIRLADRTQLFVGSIDAPETYGQPFHVMDALGSITRSFGLDPRASSIGIWGSQRSVAPFGPRGFVSARVNSYEMEFWTGDGTLERVLRRDASWFPNWTTWDSRADRSPPPPRVMEIAVDDSGLIWTLLSVADAEWRRVGAAPTEGRVLGTKQLGQLFDSIIEIIDPRTNRIVAHQRFSQMLVGMPRAGVVIENVESPDGEVVVRVWRVERTARR